MFRLLHDASCPVSAAVLFAELREQPTAAFKDTTKVVKTGEKAALEVLLTGTPPWDLWYTTPSGLKNTRVNQSPHTLLHQEEGKYILKNVTDAFCKNTVTSGQAELSVHTFSPPTATVSSISTLCKGSTATITINFVGRPPFSYQYSFAGERVTKITMSPTATFDTTEDGIFTLEQFSDYFNYSVKPEVQVTREVKFVSPPTYSITAPAYSCENAVVDVTISMAGHGQFFLEYALNQTTHKKHNIDGHFTFPIPTPTLVNVHHVRDRYGCYANSNPEKESLHIPSKSQPDIEVSGGECAPITLRFHGVPPFKLEYSFTGPNKDKTTHSREFTENAASFSEPGVFQFLSLSDSYCKRQFTNNVRTILQPPTAKLDLVHTYMKMCEIEPKSPKNQQLDLLLTGMPPFEVTIKTPEGVTELSEITTNRRSFPVSKGGEYEIIQFSDANCRGTVTGDHSKKTITIDYYPTPTVFISGSTEICQGDSTDIHFEMTGTGPWEVTFSNGKKTFHFESKSQTYNYRLSTLEFTAPQEKSGTYRIESIMDSNCKGAPGSSSADIVIHPLPTARIQGGGVICQGAETMLKISLTGTPPWGLSISQNTSDHKILMNEIAKSELEVTTDEPGFFYIDFIRDAHCKYTRTSAPVQRG